MLAICRGLPPSLANVGVGDAACGHVQDPVTERVGVLVKRHDVTRDVKINEQLTTQQEALQRYASCSAHQHVQHVHQSP